MERSAIDDHISMCHGIMLRNLGQYLPSANQQTEAELFKDELATYKSLAGAVLEAQYSLDYIYGLHKKTIDDFYSKFLHNNRQYEIILLKTVAEFRFRRGMSQVKWSELCAQMAESLYVGIQKSAQSGEPDRKKYLVTPDEIVSKLTTVEENKNMLLANPWLVVALLLSMTDPIMLPITDRAISKTITG